jgi:type IV pilus assembly protein PilA
MEGTLQNRCYLTNCAALVIFIFVVTSFCAAQTKVTRAKTEQINTPSQEPSAQWSRELDKYPGLIPEFGVLFGKLQHDIQFPPARTESRLLALLPASSTVYVAFSNYGDAANQALRIFRQELRDSSVLRDWWQHGDMATTGPKIEDSLQKLYQVSQFLGNEIVVSVTTEGRDPSLFMVAEVRNQGLKNFLQQLINADLAGKSAPALRVFDPQELVTAADRRAGQGLMVLVRPDFVVSAFDLRTLRTVSRLLDGGSEGLRSSPFGQRIEQGYQGGVTTLGAADLEKILKQIPPLKQQQTFQRTGFADMKYLVWEHKSVEGREVSQGELSFTGPRRGVASWLGPPIHPGSLEFVSPRAMMVTTIALRNPAQIFDDVKDLGTESNPNAFAQLAMMEGALGVRLKEDLLSCLGGEITFELDDATGPAPVWKAILRVTDPERLQHTLSVLQSAMHFQIQQFDENGLSYYTLQIPSKMPMAIAYAFTDGYLVVGSSHKGLAEAVRLRRTGESLANSREFLASLPPGHAEGCSALVYQDPIAMASLKLQRLGPKMPAVLPQSTGESKPAVICAYGEETTIREASVSSAADAGAVLAMAAIAIPNLLRSKIAANEASAIGTIRSVNTAEVVYARTSPQKGFASDLATLGTPTRSSAPGGRHGALLDTSFANPSCTAGTWCEKSGYRFSVTATCKQQVCAKYVVVGTPVSTSTGGRSFCSASDGVVRFKTAAPLVSPISVSECQTWQPLR